MDGEYFLSFHKDLVSVISHKRLVKINLLNKFLNQSINALKDTEEKEYIFNSNYAGRYITISGNKIIIDGKDVTADHKDAKEISIVVNGDLENLDVDYCKGIAISGNVGRVRSGSGDVNCSAVNGNVQTGSGDVECESVSGDVQTGSGDVKATTITGSVRTGSGDIKYKK